MPRTALIMSSQLISQCGTVQKQTNKQKQIAREIYQQSFEYHVQMQKCQALDFQINSKNGQMQKRRVRASYQGRHRPTMFFAKNTNIRIRVWLSLFAILNCRIYLTN